MGRRHPRQHPPGREQAVLVDAHRGARHGSKELVALADGYRESTESWADLLRDAKRRGMRAPARRRWRADNAPHLVALVRAGATFVNGKLVERSEGQQAVTPPVETVA